MKSIQALREQRNALSKEANNILANAGDKVWTVEDKAKFDGIGDQIDRLDSQILATQKQIDREAEEHFNDVDEHRHPANAVEKDKEPPARKLLAKALREGFNALTREEHALVRNTMSTTTTTQGGYSVQSGVAKELVDYLKAYGGMRTVASQIDTGDGAPLSYPTSDGTAETGEWIAENTTATASDPSFGTVALNTYKASSKIIAIPFELLQDSQIDMVAFIFKRIRDRVGRTMNAGFTTGTGSAQPNGFVTAATVGKTGTTGQTLTIIYDDLIDLIESIDYAYQEGGKCNFMMPQALRKVVRKLKDTAGRPIWTPSYDAGIGGKASADQLLGYDVVINNDMAVPAANAKTLGFGDFSKYMIRDAMQLQLFRFEDSAYAKLGQVGFLAWARAGGNLIDTNAVKVYQHSAT